MLDEVRKKMDALQMLSNGDDAYYGMLQKIRELERQCDGAVAQLPQDQQDMVWDFVSLCERMSRRMLEIACEYMDFK